MAEILQDIATITDCQYLTYSGARAVLELNSQTITRVAKTKRERERE